MDSSSEIVADTSGFRLRDIWPIVVVLVVFIAFAGVQVATLSGIGSSLAARGQFGDAFGLLSALFNGLAFAGLIITITLQSRELRLQRFELSATREEMRGQKEQLEYQSFALAKQNFEGTFFRLLQMSVRRRFPTQCQGICPGADEPDSFGT